MKDRRRNRSLGYWNSAASNFVSSDISQMSDWEALLQCRDETEEWPVKLRRRKATGYFSQAIKPMVLVLLNW